MPRRKLNCGNPTVEVRAAVAIIEKALYGVELSDVTAPGELEPLLHPKAEPLSAWAATDPGAGGAARVADPG